uniref:Uncharacterized protein n=1 Tax=Anopheles darlingi TaxID=43151 RepID=A0A2M4DS59_ANODA
MSASSSACRFVDSRINIFKSRLSKRSRSCMWCSAMSCLMRSMFSVCCSTMHCARSRSLFAWSILSCKRCSSDDRFSDANLSSSLQRRSISDSFWFNPSNVLRAFCNCWLLCCFALSFSATFWSSSLFIGSRRHCVSARSVSREQILSVNSRTFSRFCPKDWTDSCNFNFFAFISLLRDCKLFNLSALLSRLPCNSSLSRRSSFSCSRSDSRWTFRASELTPGGIFALSSSFNCSTPRFMRSSSRLFSSRILISPTIVLMS